MGCIQSSLTNRETSVQNYHNDRDEQENQRESTVNVSTVQSVSPNLNASNTLTLLLVDDISINRQLLMHQIRQVARDTQLPLTAIRFVEAENGEVALQQYQAHRPVLVITDQEMPVMTGTDFITRLKALEEDQAIKTPIVLSTTTAGYQRERVLDELAGSVIGERIADGEILISEESNKIGMQVIRDIIVPFLKRKVDAVQLPILSSDDEETLDELRNAPALMSAF